LLPINSLSIGITSLSVARGHTKYYRLYDDRGNGCLCLSALKN